MSNPAAHIEFLYSGEEESRERRLWSLLKEFDVDQLKQIAWLKDHKGCLHIGLKRDYELSISFLMTAKNAWKNLGEECVEIWQSNGKGCIFPCVID